MDGKEIKTKANLYKTCREIPIHNFFELSRTGELRYLLRDYHQEVEETEELNQIKIDIIDEYGALFKNQRNEGLMEKCELMNLEVKLQNLYVLQRLISISGMKPHIIDLAVNMNVEPESIDIYIKTLESQVKKLQKRIESESETTENYTDNLEKTLSLVKENGFNFDRFTTPIIEFVYAINRLEEKAKYYESMKKK